MSLGADPADAPAPETLAEGEATGAEAPGEQPADPAQAPLEQPAADLADPPQETPAAPALDPPSPEVPSLAAPEAEEPEDDAKDVTRGAEAQIAAVVALTLALTGFVTGLSQSKVATRPGPGPTPELGHVVPLAPTYAELAEVNLGPNAEWRSHMTQLASTPVDLLALKEVPSEAAKGKALAARAERRAYSGAPPVIPHQVAARSAASCLICHETGRRVGERVASPMPHRLLVNCLQCHAAPAPDALSSATRGVPPNTFRGQPEPLRGERASQNAPPVIPHATDMRARCGSCHGPEASSPALRTTHPWRVNCRQCHAAATAGFAK